LNMSEDIVLEIDHNNVWTDKGSRKHNHVPYHLLRDDGRDVPVIDGVARIDEIREMDSWVNWGEKVPVRRIYLDHPSVTPKVSTEYYKAGFQTFEQAVPYKSRVRADLEADGVWPLDTHGEWRKLNALTYDIEYIENKDWLTLIGYGTFDCEIKSSVDLKNEQFDFDMRFPKMCKIDQDMAQDSTEEKEILQKFVDRVEPAHLIIGQNITIYDNWMLHEKLKQYSAFQDFVKTRMDVHAGFFRGRKESHVTEILPLNFDTLLAARFLFKNMSEIGYGLKRLAIEFGLSPPDRVYERDFGGFGNWSLQNPKCLKYNQDDIYETYGLFAKEAQAILIQMFVSGLSFQDVVAGSNGRMGDHMCLVRGNKRIINPPMMHPALASRGLYAHFNGELKTKKEIFEYFNKHWSENEKSYGCTEECVKKLPKVEDSDDEEMTAHRMTDKIARIVKYGDEMPEWVEFYPMLVDYVSVGGKTDLAVSINTPFHNVFKPDVAAQYPTILKAKNITSDVIRLSRKGERVDGYCWFRRIKFKHVLELFEWKPAKDFGYSDGEGYFIGYQNRGQNGLLADALTGVIKVVGSYKKREGWKEAYEKSLKPMRNALTHGVLLNLHGTCQQFNIAGCAIPTLGQEIADNMIKYLQENGWLLLEADTDGAEFVAIKADVKPMDHYVRKIEQWWKEKLNGYPLSFDVDFFKHKVYIGMKNYVSIVEDKTTKQDVVQLKGNSLHALDKPPIAEKIMKRLMLQILPTAMTQGQFVSGVLSQSAHIVKDEFSHVNKKDLVIITSIKPPAEYNNEKNAKRARVIEEITHRVFTFPTKLEFYVCKERLPGLDSEKTEAEPIAYMWPCDVVDEIGKTIDEEWYKSMVFAYIDTAFGFEKVSTKGGLRSISSFSEQTEGSTDNSESILPRAIDHTDPPKPKVSKKQQSLF
jgi:DNA polymerase elongation subunit (family B)